MANEIEVLGYNRQKNYLPSLIGNKMKDREEMEEDEKIKNLIGSGHLLYKELNFLIYSILKLTEDINELMDSKITSRRRYLFGRYLHLNARTELIKLKTPLPKTKKDIEEYLQKEVAHEIKNEKQKLKRKIKDKSDKIQDILTDYEEKHKVDLKILSTATIYFCPNCYDIIFKNTFKRVKCEICDKSISRSSETRQMPIYIFNDNMIKMIKDNRWLEHGICNLFIQKNYQILCGFSVLGSSGVLHELDVVAESKKEKRRVFGECKTTTIGSNDILILNGKMLDVGCSEGYIFTTETDIDKTINQLAKSRNITIVDSVLEKNNEELKKIIFGKER